MTKPPPKPLVGPNLFNTPDAAPTAGAIPANVTQAWRGLWHQIGSNLPHYINESRANRRALRATLRTRG